MLFVGTVDRKHVVANRFVKACWVEDANRHIEALEGRCGGGCEPVG